MVRDLGKLLAAAAGVGLCLLALAAWRLPTSGSPPGLDLRLIAVPPGELTIDPTGVIASSSAMQAGDDPVRGVIDVRNIAGRRLSVHPLALPSAKGPVARAVRLRVTSGGLVLANGPLAQMQRPQGSGLEIPARGSRRVEVAAWLPAGELGYRGQILDVTFELRSKARGSTG